MHRIGLIGRGTWGELLQERLLTLGADVVVVDPAVDGRHISTEHPGPVDGIVVATPASTHAEVLDRLLDISSAPVFCEKPFTTDSASAIRLADAYGPRLHLMHVWRYHPGIELLGELARSGELGTVHGVRSTRTNWTSPRTDVDTTWTLLPHDVTIAIEILGHIPTPRSARAEQIDDRTVSVWADLGGPNEPWLLVEASNRFADKRREVRLHCADGVAVLTDLDTDVIEITRGAGPDALTERRRFLPGEPVTRELEAFLGHLDGGPPPKSDGAEGLAVVRVVDEIRSLARIDEPT